MKAVGWHGVGDIRLDEVSEPLEMVRTGLIDPLKILTKVEPMTNVIDAE